jgi:hypothetical protein
MDKIHQRAPDIEVRVVEMFSAGTETRIWTERRPSVIFAATSMGSYAPSRGTVLTSSDIPEERQFPRLAAAGIAAPRTLELMPGMLLNSEIWGEYVIVKRTDRRGGTDIRFVRREDVGPRYSALNNMPIAHRTLVKRYIHSVDKRGFPFEFRVLTMFGTVLYAARITAIERRPPLAEFANDLRGIPSSDSIEAKRRRTLTYEEDVLQLGRKVAAVFSESACLGIDILRESTTGELFVIEVNSGRNIWHFSSETSKTYDRTFRRSLYTQFNALDLVSDLLIEKTRALAL